MVFAAAPRAETSRTYLSSSTQHNAGRCRHKKQEMLLFFFALCSLDALCGFGNTALSWFLFVSFYLSPEVILARVIWSMSLVSAAASLFALCRVGLLSSRHFFVCLFPISVSGAVRVLFCLLVVFISRFCRTNTHTHTHTEHMMHSLVLLITRHPGTQILLHTP